MAWTRTGLALLATTALSVRLMLGEPTWLVAAVAITGSTGAVVFMLVANRRYTKVHRLLWASSEAWPARVGVTAMAARTAAGAVVTASLLLAASVVMRVVRV